MINSKISPVIKKVFTKVVFQKHNLKLDQTQQAVLQQLLKTQKCFHFKNMIQENLSLKKNPYNLELIRHENYSFRILTKDDKESALGILTQEFFDNEPQTNSYWKQFSQERKFGKEIMFQFWSMFIENSIQNQLSVGVIDLEKNQLIGVSIAKDLTYLPNGFQEKFMKNFNVISSVIFLEEEIMKSVSEQNNILFKQSGKIIDIFALTLRKKHTGKKLMFKIIFEIQKLAKKQGFQYSFAYATNFQTGIALSKIKYKKIASIQCDKFELFGKKPFRLVDQLNLRPSIWLKKLD